MYKVLIAEDEDIIRKGLIYSVPWADMDCCVVGEAANGVEGIEQIQTLRPDIVIVDINMPIKSGLEMLDETIGEYGYSAIILSGYSSFDYARTAMHLGVTDYLLKPVNREELLGAIQNAQQRSEIRSAWAVSRKQQEDLLNIKPADIPSYTENDQVVRRMLGYIEMHFSEKIVMQDVIDELNYSETFLNKRFKKATGMTFNEYLNRFRIQKAVEFLQEDGEIPAHEIGYRCGFSAGKYFSDVFRKYVGCTPKEYRDMVRRTGEN